MKYLLLFLLTPILIQPVFAQQSITVNATTPCFLNSTAGFQMLQNCDAKGDWLKFALLPFEWVTGGWFSLILITVLILAVYNKYHKTVYVMLIGVLFIPIAFALFPSNWINLALILLFVAAAILIYKGVFKQTKEY